MVVYPVDLNRYGLLDKASVLETIRVHQGPYEGTLPFSVQPTVRPGPWGCGRHRGPIGIGSRVWFAGPGGSLAPLGGPLLLSRRKRLGEFPVDQEVAQYPTRAPWYSISPAFDPRCILFVYEDGAAPDE